MKTTLVRSLPNFLKCSAVLCFIFALGACSDSSYVEGGPDPIPPPPPPSLDVVISGVILESGTTNTISNASLSFFEDGQAATNIIDVTSLETLSSTIAEDGLFQLGAEKPDKDIVYEYVIKVSADGYLDKLATLTIPVEAVELQNDDSAQIIELLVELSNSQIDAVSSVSVEQEVNGSTVSADISLSSDDDQASEDNTEGKGEVIIPAGIQFVDSDNNPVDVTSVTLEVKYMESQESETAEEQSFSIAEVIPEGLNSDEDVAEVLVPIGLTEVNLTDENGTAIKNFSGDITVTIFLPDTTIDPSTGSPITVDSNLRVRTFDTETLTWTTEPREAVNIRAKDADNLFPVDITVNHLTIFALTAEVAACTNDVAFNFTGDAVPAAGLDLVIETGDLKKVFSIPSSAADLTILANEVKAAGIMQDVDSYSVYVENTLGDLWSVEDTSEPEVIEPVVVEPSVEADITVPQSTTATQNVYISEAQLSEDGSQITMTISYLADDATLTGVGFSASFDSSVLTFNSVSDVFAGAIAGGSLNEAGDSLAFGWASLFGSFPGSETALLAKVIFDVANGASGTTSLEFSETSSAATHTLVLQSQQLVFVAGSDGTDGTDVATGIELCVDEDIVVELENPVDETIPLVSEELTLSRVCSQDNTVSTSLAKAIVTYTSDSNPIPQVAAETSGSYQLVNLDSSVSYTVSVNTRTDAGVVVYTDLQPDGVNEEREIEESCIVLTGTGTGSS